VYAANKGSYVAGAAQQSNPFCNAGNADSARSGVTGINLGYAPNAAVTCTGATCGLTGPNWNVKLGESDFADLDPVRVPCDGDGQNPNPAGGDQVCGHDWDPANPFKTVWTTVGPANTGKVGLVLVVFPPDQQNPINPAD